MALITLIALCIGLAIYFGITKHDGLVIRDIACEREKQKRISLISGEEFVY